MKRSRENGQEAEADVEPAPKKAFGFEMKLSSNMVKLFLPRMFNVNFQFIAVHRVSVVYCRRRSIVFNILYVINFSCRVSFGKRSLGGVGTGGGGVAQLTLSLLEQQCKINGFT